MQDFIFNVGHQLNEHIVSLRLIFDERVLLRIGAQINALAQRVHGIEVFLPQPIDRVQDNVTFQTLYCGWFLVRRFPLVRLLDFLDQKLRVPVRLAAFKLCTLFI